MSLKKDYTSSNIRTLRTIYNEKQQELGDSIGVASTTISMYESGKRKPETEILLSIAKHYGITIDKLINVDLSDINNIEKTISWEDINNVFMNVMPLLSSKKALENNNFNRAYNRCLQLIENSKNYYAITLNEITSIIEDYEVAANHDIIEGIANQIWLFCLIGSSVNNPKSEKIANLLYKNRGMKPLEFKKLLTVNDEYKNYDKNEKKDFIDDINSVITPLIGILKKDKRLSDIADYYLALCYILDLVNNDYNAETNQAIGLEMICAFTAVGNEYALAFLRATSDL